MDSAPPARRRASFAAKILIAMVLGVIVGEVLGTRADPLKSLGSVILDLIKGLAGPLLLFAVLDAFLRTPVGARSGGRMVAITLTNALIAVVIGLSIANLLQPGRALRSIAISEQARAGFEQMTRSVAPDRRIDFFGDLLALVPTSIVRPFLDNAILSIIVLAVLGGCALRRVKTEQIARGEDDYLAVERFVGTAYRAVEIALAWVIALVPIAVFGVVAQTVGTWGLREPMRGLAVYLAVGMLGLGIQILVVYRTWLVWVARMPVRQFWRGARDAVVYAMGTGSSLASLPVTLRQLDRMGVSPQSARMAACVGTNLNNDGILLYEAMAVLFVAQACGVELSLGEQLVAAAACVIAGIGISGIPEAGLISLLLVLKTVRVVPDEQVALVVPLLLTVDWILGRARAMTNVTSDMLVAVLLDRFERGHATPAAQGDWPEAGLPTDARGGLEIAFPSEGDSIRVDDRT